MAVTHFSSPIRLAAVKGGAAGDLTVTGIKSIDNLISVQSITWDTDADPASVSDVTSEFSITADDTINNAGGTTTADKLVLVLYEQRSASDGGTAQG